jgi:hypothetical protein
MMLVCATGFFILFFMGLFFPPDKFPDNNGTLTNAEEEVHETEEMTDRENDSDKSS